MPLLNKILLIFLSCLLFMTWGCIQDKTTTEVYRETGENIPGALSFIELRSDGVGTWETDIDLVHFRWKTRGDQIWLHTQEGRSIPGMLTEEGFNIYLQNLETLIFVRQ
ncbi:MAG: hypothetical protein ACLFRQ_02765 [Desulfonatronovibrio sp.]